MGLLVFHLVLLQIHYCFLCLKLYRNIVKYQSLRQVAAYRNLKTVSVTCVQLSLVHFISIDLSFEALAIRGGAPRLNEMIERPDILARAFRVLVCVGEYKNQRAAASPRQPNIVHRVENKAQRQQRNKSKGLIVVCSLVFLTQHQLNQLLNTSVSHVIAKNCIYSSRRRGKDTARCSTSKIINYISLISQHRIEINMSRAYVTQYKHTQELVFISHLGGNRYKKHVK
jgi:hypothetical protein